MTKDFLMDSDMERRLFRLSEFMPRINQLNLGKFGKI